MKDLGKVALASAGMIALTWSANASATELLFDYDEDGDGRDLQFILDSEPDPSTSIAPLYFSLPGVVDQLTDQTFVQGIFWTPSANGGGFSLEDSTGAVVGGLGEQLFTGKVDNPMFKIGTFDLLSRTAEESATLTIAPVPATVVFNWNADGDGQDYRFSFDVNPVPDYLDPQGNYFSVGNLVDQLNGETLTASFFTSTGNGGLSFSNEAGAILGGDHGDQLFFNTLDNPVFRTGSFRLDGTPGATGGLLTITAHPLNAVPEPATWAMMLLGFGMVGAMMRPKAKKSKVRVRYF